MPEHFQTTCHLQHDGLVMDSAPCRLTHVRCSHICSQCINVPVNCTKPLASPQSPLSQETIVGWRILPEARLMRPHMTPVSKIFLLKLRPASYSHTGGSPLPEEHIGRKYHYKPHVLHRRCSTIAQATVSWIPLKVVFFR